jgi:hypothetical protein
MTCPIRLAFALCAILVSAPAAAEIPTLGPPVVTPPPVGARVLDDKGKPAGRVEKVIRGPDGRPLQVEVRVNRVLRTLPLLALSPTAGPYICVLSRAELLALPPSN